MILQNNSTKNNSFGSFFENPFHFSAFFETADSALVGEEGSCGDTMLAFAK